MLLWQIHSKNVTYACASQVEGELQGRVKRVMIPRKRSALNRICGRGNHCWHEMKRILDRHRDLADFYHHPVRAFDGVRIGENCDMDCR